jgi:hypothetical protein
MSEKRTLPPLCIANSRNPPMAGAIQIRSFCKGAPERAPGRWTEHPVSQYRYM